MEPISPEPLHVVFAHADEYEAELFFDILTDVYPKQYTHCTHVTDGRLLLNHVELNKTHIVFLETNLQLRNGLQCVEHLRAHATYNRVALVMYSNYHTTADVNRCFKAGANLFIHAPLTSRSIRHRLHYAIKLYKTGCIYNTTRNAFYCRRR